MSIGLLTKSFDGRTIFKNVNFTIHYGGKVSIIGSNGSGKTTLLKVIVGQETVEGDVWISPSANIGYLTQEVFDLPLEQTPEQLCNITLEHVLIHFFQNMLLLFIFKSRI